MSENQENTSERFKQIMRELDEEIQEKESGIKDSKDEKGGDQEIEIKIITGKIDNMINSLEKHLGDDIPKEVLNEINTIVDKIKKDVESSQKALHEIDKALSADVAKIIKSIDKDILDASFKSDLASHQLKREIFGITMAIISCLVRNRKVKINKRKKEY